MLRAVVALLFVCTTSAALAQSPPPAPAPRVKPAPAAKPAPAKPSGRSVCVASAIGHKFRVQKIGLTMFTNSVNDVSVESWGIDDLVVRTIATILGRHGMQVRRVNLPATGLVAFETEKRELFHDYGKDLVELVRRAALTAPKCDSYLVLTRGSSTFSNTNQSVTGLGILQRGEDYWFALHLLYGVVGADLYDGTTFARRKGGWIGWAPFENFLNGDGVHGMSRRVDKTWWPDPPQSVAQSTKTRDAVREMVVQGLAHNVAKLFAPE